MKLSPKDKLLVGVLGIAAGLSVGAAALFGPAGDPPPDPELTSPPSSTILEDEPGWDCHTMGNRICGP